MPVTIEIVRQNADVDTQTIHADIEISDGVNAYAWGVGGVPIDTPSVQVYLDSHAVKFWRQASAKAQPADVMEQISERVLLRALMVAMLDEINTLRVAAGLEPRTLAQMRSALKTQIGQ